MQHDTACRVPSRRVDRHSRPMAGRDFSPQERQLIYALARNVRRLREEQGLTQEEAAAAAGIQPRSWQRIEAKKQAPTLETIGKLAAALDVDPLELFAHCQPRS
jgi:DNA-binding XRE family transcriptional regulator